MAGWWRALPRAASRYPWPTNVLLYSALFSAGDAVQQRLRGGPADWRQTRRVATVAVAFHGNFNYVWLRLLERALPGRAPRTVLAKVLCDQALGGPVAISAFYAGMSILQGEDDIFLDLKQKFWNTYKVVLARAALRTCLFSSRFCVFHRGNSWKVKLANFTISLNNGECGRSERRDS
uniref:MPV17 mitochondrial inner membrane protein like n=1 Tax=Equus caballus TaxID=9796 RepID=A0A9L0QZV2_HORSE